MLGYKDILLRSHEDDTVVTRAYTGKTCRVIANRYTRKVRETAGLAELFPQQVLRIHERGRHHLGSDETTPGVDPGASSSRRARERGRHRQPRPAADLVAQFVDEAEAVLAKLRP